MSVSKLTPENRGWFPEGGFLDSIDKSLSSPIFRLSLGKLEYLLSVPGCWFGLPLAAWGILPLYVGGYQALLRNPEEAYFFTKYFSIPLTSLLLIYWFKWIKRDEVREAYLATKPLLPFLVFGTPLLTRQFMPSGYAVTCFTASAWCFGEIFSHVVKITSRRMRPLTCMPELKQVHRELPQLQTVLKVGETAFQSFPSGDACGGATVSTALFLLRGSTPLVYWPPVLLCSLGRIYFHAHHLSDVVVGSLFGYLSTRFLDNTIGMENFRWSHVLGFMTLFIAFHRSCHKFIKFEVPEEYKIGDSIYGRKHTKDE